MPNGLSRGRAALAALFLMSLMVGCAAMGSVTHGQSGPVEWWVANPQVEVRQVGNETRQVYEFTLVLKNASSSGITIRSIEGTVGEPRAATVGTTSELVSFRLEPNREVRRLYSSSRRCLSTAGREQCPEINRPFIPMWQFVFAGTEDGGKPVSFSIQIALPADAKISPPDQPAKPVTSTSAQAPVIALPPQMAKEQASRSTASIPVPVWRLGDEWEYRWESPRGKGTFVWKVDRVEWLEGVEFYVLKAGKRESYWRKSDLAFYMDKDDDGAVETRYVPAQEGYSWPLAPAKTWAQRPTRERPIDRQTQEYPMACQVEAEETVTVPAGVFQALKIGCYNPLTGGTLFRRWYSPQVRQWVREEGNFPYGIRVRELMSFRLK